MRSTGVIRKVDELGRFVVPKEIRNQLGLTDIDNELEIFVINGDIVLRKHNTQNCIFCGNKEDIAEFKGKYLCRQCISELK